MTLIGSADITVDLLDASYQLKKNQLRIDLNELQETRFIKIDLDALNFEYKRLKLKNSIEELSTLKLTSNLSSQLAERNITQAQYEKESYDIAYNAAQKRIGIAKDEADSVARQLYKAAVVAPRKTEDFVAEEFALLRKIEQAKKDIVPLLTYNQELKILKHMERMKSVVPFIQNLDLTQM
jgi:deoxyribodipyrimidine photolyase